MTRPTWRTFVVTICRVSAGILILVLLLMTGVGVMAQREGWSVPVMISTNTVSSWFSDVVVDDWGQPHIVYNSGQPSGAGRGQEDLLMYTTVSDSGWLEPNDIAVTAYGGYTVRPAIAVDNSGILHVTFRGETIIYYTSAPVSEAWNANRWAPPTRMSGSGTNSAYYSDVAVDDQGTIHVVWNEGVSTGVDQRWLWIATLGGTAIYDNGDWRTEEIYKRLENREIYAMVEDSDGVQWFGTDGGAYSFDGSSWQVYSRADGLAGNKVNCIAQDMDGDLWFGTDSGLSRYNAEERSLADRWTTYTSLTGLPGDVVHTISADPFWGMWVGTEKGLANYDGETWTNYTSQSGLDTEILAIAVGRQRDVWVGSSQGLSHYDALTWTLYTEDQGLLSNEVSTIVVEQDGAVWCGTGRGVSRFDGAQWTSYVSGEGPSNGTVTALLADSEGMVWVGTETGASYFDGQAWVPFELPLEFTDREITAIAEDRLVNATCPSCADIFYRRSTDGGRSWSAPVNLSNSFAGSVKPQVRAGTGNSIHVTWEEGEDWYLFEGYPVASMYIHSLDGGYTWDEPVTFSSTLGAPQQITFEVRQEGDVIVVWRIPEYSQFYYQLSTDNGVTWSEPETIPGVIANAWLPFSLYAYDAATDGAGNVHLLVLGHLYSLDDDLGVVHLVWNGRRWSAPTLLYSSSNPPEWPRIAVGAGNQVYATWFTRDERHIEDPDRGRYKIWVSYYESDAPQQMADPLPTPSPTPTLDTTDSATPTPTVTPALGEGLDGSGLPPGLYTESDEVGQLIIALFPIILILLVIIALRFSWFKRPR